MSLTTQRRRKRKARGKLTSEQQLLAEQYLPLARRIAKPLKDANPNDWEEYESAACLALVEAAESFDPDRHVKFATYAQRRIWGALQDVRRRKRIRSRAMTSDRTRLEFGGIPYDAECKGRVLMMQPAESIGNDLEAKEEAESWFRRLPRGHAAACRQIYLQGKTHAEAGSALGLSPSRVTYIHLEAVAMLNGTWEGRRPKAARGRMRPN